MIWPISCSDTCLCKESLKFRSKEAVINKFKNEPTCISSISYPDLFSDIICTYSIILDFVRMAYFHRQLFFPFIFIFWVKSSMAGIYRYIIVTTQSNLTLALAYQYCQNNSCFGSFIVSKFFHIILFHSAFKTKGDLKHLGGIQSHCRDWWSTWCDK